MHLVGVAVAVVPDAATFFSNKQPLSEKEHYSVY